MLLGNEVRRRSLGPRGFYLQATVAGFHDPLEPAIEDCR